MYLTSSRAQTLIRETARAGRVLSNPVRRRYLSITRADHDGPRIIANSIPKSGTHLLMQCLSLFPDLKLYHDGVLYPGVMKEQLPPRLLRRFRRRRASLARMGHGCFAMVHWPYSERAVQFAREQNFRTVLMVRDPRDTVVAFYRFEMKRRRHGYHGAFCALPDDEARLRAAIAGDAGLGIPDVATRLEGFARWLPHLSCVVRFENLIGQQGGGSRVAQVREIERLSRGIGMAMTGDQVAYIADHVFDARSRTFRRGMIGQWVHEFTDEHKELFKQTAGDYLVKFGYEVDSNW